STAHPNTVSAAESAFGPSSIPQHVPAAYSFSMAFQDRQAAHDAYANAIVPSMRCIAALVFATANDADLRDLRTNPSLLRTRKLRAIGAASTANAFSALIHGKGEQDVIVVAGYSQNVLLVVALLSAARTSMPEAVVAQVL